MDWITKYQLVLLDLDGLLVNTENLHCHAYIEMCKRRGLNLSWSLEDFFAIAHKSSTGVRSAIYAAFPDLKENWNVLYTEKQALVLELLEKEKINLLNGVDSFLQVLQEMDIKRCVVTNSEKEMVDIIRAKNPLLNSIPYWITRECYENPKPNPECYLKAQAILKEENDNVIGFEDSLRGYNALKAAGAKAILVCPKTHPQLEGVDLCNILHFESLKLVEA